MSDEVSIRIIGPAEAAARSVLRLSEAFGSVGVRGPYPSRDDPAHARFYVTAQPRAGRQEPLDCGHTQAEHDEHDLGCTCLDGQYCALALDHHQVSGSQGARDSGPAGPDSTSETSGADFPGPAGDPGPASGEDRSSTPGTGARRGPRVTVAAVYEVACEQCGVVFRGDVKRVEADQRARDHRASLLHALESGGRS